MTISSIQSAFSAGEISPELFGEVSLAKLASAATTLRNAIVNYRGGALSRAGLALVGVCLQSTYLRLGTSTGPPRTINFQYANNQGYSLEFGDGYLRFVFQGGYVVESPIAASAATNANPCVVTTATSNFANGDWVFASGFQGMTQLNGNTYVVSAFAGASFALQDLYGNNINSTGFGTYTGGGTFSRIYTVVSPYQAKDLPYLKFSETANSMSLACSNPQTGNEYPPYDLIRWAPADWTLQPSNFVPSIQPPASVSATAVTIPMSGVGASFAYEVTATDSGGNESVASAIATCHGSDFQVNAGGNTVTWATVPGARYYNIYRAPVSIDNAGTPVPVPEGSIFGFVGSAYATQFTDDNTTPDLSQTPPTHDVPFAPGRVLSATVTGVGSAVSIPLSLSYTTKTGQNFAATAAVTNSTLGAVLISGHGEFFVPGDSISFNSLGFAQGAILFGTTNPLNGDTITLNGVTWTFVNNISGAAQTIIGLTVADTLTALTANLANSANGTITACAYSVDILGQNLIVTSINDSAGGNAFTLAASRASVSGATLTGGFGGPGDGSPTNSIGDLNFGGNPTNGQTIILDGVTWTFVTSGATGNQTNLGVNLAATLKQLAQDLNASSNSLLSAAAYGATGAKIQVMYIVGGTVGNAYTLNGGTSGATPSAATLTGGGDATVPTGQLVIGPTSGTYPGVVGYFQQRRFFACSIVQPDTIWASQTGLYANFDSSIPTRATDGITASPWTEQVNGIQWLIPMPGGLIAMTGLRAWQIIGEGSYQLNVQPITPSTTQAQPQAFNGCSATIPPIVIDYDVLYVQAIGQTTVFDLAWNFWVNIYTGNDLTILSSHLFLNRQIVQWAWSRQPYKVLWACCDDGTMISLTYLKEQSVYGWSRHDTQGLVVSMCSVTEPPVNGVYAIVQRFPPFAPQGIYVMERFDNRLWQTAEDPFCVDSAVSNSMSFPAANVFASSITGAVTFKSTASVFSSGNVGQVLRMAGGIATIGAFTSATQISGTWVLGPSPAPMGGAFATSGSWSLSTPVSALNAPHLGGMTVAGLADGVPIGPITVGATGTITLPFSASDVKVGLGYTVQLQTPYLNGDAAVQGARKVIPAASFRLNASGNGFQTGTNQPDGAAQNPPQIAPAWTNLATADVVGNPTGGQDPAGQYTSPSGHTVTKLWTGDERVIGGGASWVSKGQVAIQQTQPLPLEVLAILPEMLPGDIPEIRAQPKRDPKEPAPGPGRWMLTG